MEEGDKVILTNVSTNALLKAQEAFQGMAEELGIENEQDVIKLVKEIRSERGEQYKCELSSFIIDELSAVVARKFPKKKYAVDSFLSDLSYELVYTPRHMPGDLFKIRDINDYPVLYTAIIENIDIFITVDKDFLDVDIEMPEIMAPGEFLERFILQS